MTEEGNNDKYIICSKCRSKYINDEEHINKDFVYTILEMIYKTCVRCRARSKLTNNTYSEKHPEQIKEYHEAHKEERTEYDKQYREKTVDRLKEYDRARNQLKVYCPHCEREIITRKMNSHLQSQKCKQKPHPNDDRIIVGGRTYLKGKSPLEGVWHCDHTPFDIKYYTTFENGVSPGVKITTIEHYIEDELKMIIAFIGMT